MSIGEAWQGDPDRSEVGAVLACIVLLITVLVGVAALSQLRLRRVDQKQRLFEPRASLDLQFLKVLNEISPCLGADALAHRHKEFISSQSPSSQRSSSDWESWRDSNGSTSAPPKHHQGPGLSAPAVRSQDL
ncbi:MAG: hypothetical protein WDW38_009650 [Sanguina aurantia]